MDAHDELLRRLNVLEKRVTSYHIGLGFALAALVLLAVTWSPAVRAQDSSVIRAKGLVIEDVSGRARIRIGAPVQEASGRTSPCTGLRIDDANGVERFATCLYDNGRMGMGFDAPPGKGDDRNRERINIAADAEGGAYIRFLNRKTLIPGRLTLGEDDKLYLEFQETLAPGRIRVKRLSFSGEQVTELP